MHTVSGTPAQAYIFTNYSSSSGGSIINQVQCDFNGLGQLTAEHQAINGSVTVGTTPSVGYTYTEMSGGANHSRPTKMTYPDGFELRSNYGSGGGVNDRISRLAWLEDGTSTIEEYSYLGLGTVVRRNRPAIDIELTYIKQHGESNGSAGDQYAGLDSFGRIVDQRWRDTSDGSHTDRWQYGYDRNGNRLYKDNLLDNDFDELYHTNGASNGYDLLNQLTDFRRGALSDTNSDGVPDTVTTADRNQSWAFDGLGNFPSVTTDTTTVNRTHNRQNQVTTVGAATLTFDDNGNMTTDETGRTLTYDAWNRLITVTEGKSTQTYEYDALYRRVEEGSNQLYYTAGWQVIEERVSGVAEARYVWSPVYVDAMILRDRDVTGDATLEERLWVQHDANWNVSALVNASGTVAERYAYDPYGRATILNSDFSTVRSVSLYSAVHLFQGLRWNATVGQYFSQTRGLSSALGRWDRLDPILFSAGDQNLYRAMANNPVKYTDPTGKILPLLILGGAILIGGTTVAVNSGLPEMIGETFPETLAGPTDDYFGRVAHKIEGRTVNGYIETATCAVNVRTSNVMKFGSPVGHSNWLISQTPPQTRRILVRSGVSQFMLFAFIAEGAWDGVVVIEAFIEAGVE